MKSGNTFLNRMLTDSGMTQIQLSAATGVTQQTISKLLSGVHKTPSRKTAVQLATFYGVSTDEVYNEGNHHVL
jgi:transcriptional regulator with XRE-family HTH domain